MQQLSLACDGRTPWDVLLRAISDAVYHLGFKDVTFELNVGKSTLSDALRGQNDRHWRQEWTLTVLGMLVARYSDASNQFAKAILDAQAVVTRRFEIVAIDDAPTDDEIAVAERVLAKAKRRSGSQR